MSGFLDSFTIVPSSLQVNGGNKLQYSLAPGGDDLPADSTVGLSNLKVTNSFTNITSVSTPVTFVGNTGTSYTGTFLPGTYNYADINTELTTLQYNAGDYLLDPIGDVVTFINFGYSPNYHTTEVVATPVPTALTGIYAGYTNPAGISLNGLTPTINFGGYGPILGLTGTYPPSSTGVAVTYFGTGAFLNAGMVLVRGNISSDNSLGSNESAGVLGSFYVAPTDLAEQLYDVSINNIKRLRMSGRQNQLYLEMYCSNPQQLMLPQTSSLFVELAVFRP